MLNAKFDDLIKKVFNGVYSSWRCKAFPGYQQASFAATVEDMPT